jgi:hypothetical protein
MTAVATRTYNRTHTTVFASDKLRNFLKLLVRQYGLDPQGVIDAWSSWVDRAARTWFESGHLEAITIEFYRPGSDDAAALWDFPIRYDGNGTDDDMWIDRRLFEDSIAKSKTPPSDCTYRIVLRTLQNEPPVPGVGPTTLRSIKGLVSREIGTVVSTPDIMASGRYYR